MKKIETPAEIVLEPAGAAKAAVIWLHGLGADGGDFVPIVPELGIDAAAGVRFVFPHAPVRPVTINAGFRMRAWYDIVGLDAASRVDEEGIRESAQRIDAYIAQQVAGGIPSGRIVLAGFSQGGAVALHCALRQRARLAGLVALSTYLPLHDQLRSQRSSANEGLPIFLAHGRYDPIVPFALGEATRIHLHDLGYTVDWHEYPMQHEVCAGQIDDLRRWLQRTLTVRA